MPATRSSRQGKEGKDSRGEEDHRETNSKESKDKDTTSVPMNKRGSYFLTKSERFVFGTPPYSAHIKPMWRFKNEEEAKKSASQIYNEFQVYRENRDFIGMDVCRKFLQMGRTRSTRYALRPGGRKYTQVDGEKVEMERTGKVYDREKLNGAQVFKEYEEKCWKDTTYTRLWEDYK